MIESCGLVTITTDFGSKEAYVGMMKGAIYCANPHARIVDITHDVAPHDIIGAAFTLARAYEYFPEGTVHVAVIDPEVGGKRLNIVVRTSRFFFVGPNNGIFALALSRERDVEIREIVNPPFVRPRVSSTFHGRDVYGPCAGQISGGSAFEAVGPAVEQLVRLDYPKTRQDGDTLVGEIVSVDSFGNLITNISEHTLKSFAGRRKIEIYFANERFNEIRDHYSEVPKKTPLILYSSSGYLEISMNEGNAARYFMLSTGALVTVRRLR
jgi:S-adenosylmethionine hydrolase